MTPSFDTWKHALSLLDGYLKTPQKAEFLLQQLPKHIDPKTRQRSQALFNTTLRNLILLDQSLAALIRPNTKAKLRCLLLLAGAEMLEKLDASPAVVDFAVRYAKKHLSLAESRLVNAVLRKLSGSLKATINAPAKTASELSLKYSHPEWLVTRWLKTWPLDTVTQLLELNQSKPDLYARLRTSHSHPAYIPTGLDKFVKISSNISEIEKNLQGNKLYIQDPATRHAIDLLNPQPGERILDLCAAPGGKSLGIADRMEGQGAILCVDKPERSKRLHENLRNTPIAKILESDAFTLDPAQVGQFDAILLDVPCSNTGVIRRKPDVKYRLQPEDLKELEALQYAFLEKAVTLLKPGGRIVYSTCSIDPEENDLLIKRFLDAHRNYRLTASEASLPWKTNHDGSAAFLIEN